MNLKGIVTYLNEGFGGNWSTERTAVWTDQLKASKLSLEVLRDAARDYVGKAGFPRISEFLETANEIQRVRALEHQSEEVLAIPEGALPPEDAKERLDQIRRILKAPNRAVAPVQRELRTIHPKTGAKDIAAERARAKRRLEERGE